MILRTTNLSTNSSMMGSITSAQNKLNKLTAQLSSQKKVSSLTDDAVAAKSILNITKESNQIQSYVDNMEQAKTELDTADKTFATAIKNVQRAYDIGMMASNGTYGDDEIYAFKVELDSIIDNLREVANTKFNDNYIFAGARTRTTPYVETEDGMSYNGSNATSNSKREIVVGDGVAEAINQTGDVLFGHASYIKDPITNEITGVDGEGIFKTLYELKLALGADDFDDSQARATLDGFGKGMTTLADARSNVGVTSNRFDILIESYTNDQAQLTALKSSLEDIDIAEVVSQWTTQQYALQASSSIASRLLQQNIMNYL